MATQNYVAFDHNDNRITNVTAVNEQHAKAQVRDMLDRPGRRAILAAWQKGGWVVKQMTNRIFTYAGGEHGMTTPTEVMLRGVRKANADPDSHAGYLRTDVDIARHGGMQPGDTAFVQPWNREARRWSFIECDLPAGELTPVTGITD